MTIFPKKSLVLLIIAVSLCPSSATSDERFLATSQGCVDGQAALYDNNPTLKQARDAVYNAKIAAVSDNFNCPIVDDNDDSNSTTCCCTIDEATFTAAAIFQQVCESIGGVVETFNAIIPCDMIHVTSQTRTSKEISYLNSAECFNKTTCNDIEQQHVEQDNGLALLSVVQTTLSLKARSFVADCQTITKNNNDDPITSAAAVATVPFIPLFLSSSIWTVTSLVWTILVGTFGFL